MLRENLTTSGDSNCAAGGFVNRLQYDLPSFEISRLTATDLMTDPSVELASWQSRANFGTPTGTNAILNRQVKRDTALAIAGRNWQTPLHPFSEIVFSEGQFILDPSMVKRRV